jgi:hypothetical protein
MKRKVMYLIIATACIAGGVWSELTGTYYEATSDNTIKIGGTWMDRNNCPVSENGTAFEGLNSLDEFPDAYLITTITGLTAGVQYEIGVVYVGRSDSGWQWNVDVTLDTNSTWNSYYYGDGVSTVDAGSNPYRMQAIFGTNMANGSGEIEVYVARHEYGLDEDRIRYDGLTYRKMTAPLGLFGITKAVPTTENFISAVLSQDIACVFIRTIILGQIDQFHGFKEKATMKPSLVGSGFLLNENIRSVKFNSKASFESAVRLNPLDIQEASTAKL